MAEPPSLMSRDAVARALAEGFAALNAGDAKRAAAKCQEAIALDRTHPEAHFLVGLVALEMNDSKTAASAFGSVATLSPTHAAAWAQLSRVLMRLGQPARAEEAAAKAAALDPVDPAVQDLIGVVYSLLGDQRAAKSWYEKAVAGAPDRTPYKVNLATTLTFLGETAAAEKLLTQLLMTDPDVAQAQWLLSSLRKATAPDRAHMLAAKSAHAGHRQEAAFFAYAAGKEFEDCAAWEDAFKAFSAGAKAKRATIDYDERAEDGMFAALDEIFTEDWLLSRGTGEADPSPIFVVGQPRTGTTLIERIITSHSMVESAGELQQFGLSVRRAAKTHSKNRFSPEAALSAKDVDVGSVGREYLRTTAPMRSGAPRFVDKLPVNYIHLPLILAALPNAKIVHLTRNPLDSCFASFKQLFADTYLHSYDQEEMARHHLRYLRLMKAWRERFPGRFLDVSYEATVSDLEPNARALIEFLGLEWEDACLSFYERADAVTTASAVQVREKPHTRSVGRWRRYENQLSPMRKILSQGGAINDSGDSFL